MKLANVTLDDKYGLSEGRAYMTGTQALVRLPLIQIQRDRAAGLNTAGFISGYRGSPLGGYDQALLQAGATLDDHNVKFVPGVNEELAATAVWGSQQVNLYEGAKYDGVFGVWYGKGPGVDRTGDTFRHANAAGTSPHGGVLALAGDDHAAKSSTLPHQSDHSFYSTMMPMLYPASIHEFVEYGLMGIAMSRYSGCWTAFKVIAETVEASATVSLEGEKRQILIPTDEEFEMPPGGVHIRLNDEWHELDWRLQRYKLFAALAFCRKNKLDRIIYDSPEPRFGIITSGKSYEDVRQALRELGITREIAAEIGMRLYKVAMPWPLEPEGARHFAEGLEEVLVVEEKRELIENQFKQQLFNWRADVRPLVVGKHDETGKWLLPPENDLSVGQIAHVIATRIARFYKNDRIKERLAFYTEREEKIAGFMPPSVRKPYFCSGCPHNTSTKVPEGSKAMAGIGCHIMSMWMDRDTETFTQMGGEGTPWIGMAPFTERQHMYVNLGDGTYFHSGILAIRASVSAGVNVTYKLLYNDAVAMTGGQHVDGTLTVPMLARQLEAEGVKKIVILTEDMGRYPTREGIPEGIPILDRDELDRVQLELRDTPGCTALIFDQTCAAEKRRRRKRGKFPDPDKRIFINDAVCEGCGDCSVQSNCVSVEPLETEFGRKRVINQSTCNKDYSCIKGFCPSFVTVYGATPRKSKASGGLEAEIENIPLPVLPELKQPFNIIVTGIGGTGVLTIGALIGMAAHLENKAATVMDMAGLAQKGGAVLSHIRIGPDIAELRTPRIVTGSADALLACDLVVAASKEVVNLLNADRTVAVVNSHMTPVADFVRDKNIDFKDAGLRQVLKQNLGADAIHYFEGSELATALLGDSIATNVFMLGVAFQKGLIPVSADAIERAIELNGVAVKANLKTFAYGRLAVYAPDKVAEAVKPVLTAFETEEISQTLDDVIDKRVKFLTGYQDAAYAGKYLELVNQVKSVEAEKVPGKTDLTEAASRWYFKLLAYKDEYEVARLFASDDFRKKLEAQFEGDYKVSLNLAPPIMSKPDPRTGRPMKREFGPWMLTAMKVLQKFKKLRGTPFDIFGYSAERRMERQQIADYEQMMEGLLAGLTPANHSLACEIAALPDELRGYGPIKEENARKMAARKAELLKRFQNGDPALRAA